MAAAARLSDAEAAVEDPEAEFSACVDARAVELLDAEVLAASEVSEADEDEDEPPSLWVVKAALDVSPEMTITLEADGSTLAVEIASAELALPVSSGASATSVSWLRLSKSRPISDAWASMLLRRAGSAVAVNWSRVAMTAEMSASTLLTMALGSAVDSARAERTLFCRLAVAEAKAAVSRFSIADRTEAAYWEPSWAEARAAKAARWLRTRLEETNMLGFGMSVVRVKHTKFDHRERNRKGVSGIGFARTCTFACALAIVHWK